MTTKRAGAFPEKNVRLQATQPLTGTPAPGQHSQRNATQVAQL